MHEAGNMRSLRVLFLAIFLLSLVPALAGISFAGPPFVTDDPEPVEYRHWEIYLASQNAKDKDGWSGTAPHFEVNYGAWSNLQLHLIAPLAYVKPDDGPSHYGFGDLELGAKYRFIQESDWRPMVGTFLIFDLPTGNSSRGLGSGHLRTFLPIWLQKSWGPWTSYGGGGYWINPGSENKNYWFFGWQVQRDLSKIITLGAEVFYNTPTANGEGGRTGFNVGTIINFTDEHHLLFSAGRDIHGQNRFSTYISYQLTFGPREEKKEVPPSQKKQD
ncbi:MAG TPA: transporter [Thermodesulfobacteriota bacterium]|nr:transporter [Thermodesulfobacteriota bacterium]